MVMRDWEGEFQSLGGAAVASSGRDWEAEYTAASKPLPAARDWEAEFASVGPAPRQEYETTREYNMRAASERGLDPARFDKEYPDQSWRDVPIIEKRLGIKRRKSLEYEEDEWNDAGLTLSPTATATERAAAVNLNRLRDVTPKLGIDAVGKAIESGDVKEGFRFIDDMGQMRIVADGKAKPVSPEVQTILAEKMRLDEWTKRESKSDSFPRLKATALRSGTDVNALVARLIGKDKEADSLLRLASAYDARAAEYDAKGDMPAWLMRAARGVGSTLPNTIAAGMATGPYGAIGLAASMEANRGITEGREAGLSWSKLADYAVRAGTIEALPAIIMQRVGLGGVESVVGQGGKAAVSQGVGAALKQAGKVAAQELPEELVTEIGHNINQALSGVEKDALTPGNLAQTAFDTTVQTLMTVGLVESPMIFDAAIQQKLASLPEQPSRTDWQKADLPRDLGMSAEDRKLLRDSAIRYAQREGFTAKQQQPPPNEPAAAQPGPTEPPKEPPPNTKGPANAQETVRPEEAAEVRPEEAGPPPDASTPPQSEPTAQAPASPAPATSPLQTAQEIKPGTQLVVNGQPATVREVTPEGQVRVVTNTMKPLMLTYEQAQAATTVEDQPQLPPPPPPPVRKPKSKPVKPVKPTRGVYHENVVKTAEEYGVKPKDLMAVARETRKELARQADDRKKLRTEAMRVLGIRAFNLPKLRTLDPRSIPGLDNYATDLANRSDYADVFGNTDDPARVLYDAIIAPPNAVPLLSDPGLLAEAARRIQPEVDDTPFDIPEYTEEELAAMGEQGRADEEEESFSRPVGASADNPRKRPADKGAKIDRGTTAKPTAKLQENLDPRHRDIEFRSMPVPALVQLARDLLGNIPAVKKLKAYLGVFYHSGSIAIEAARGADPIGLAKTLAHEIGHAIDWLPGKTMDRGNILGRLASVRDYLKEYIEGYEGGPSPLTDEDRKRLWEEAKILNQETTWTEIEEVIRQTMPVTAQDVINIWNSLDTSKLNARLHAYIKGLSDGEKASIVKEAMRGVVREQLQQFAEEVTTETIKKRVETVKYGSHEDRKRMFEGMIFDEAKKRELLSNETIRDELIRLAGWWRGYTPKQLSKAEKRYRHSSKELYAEALSVFLNAPGDLALLAPEFYRGFSNYLGRKPEVLRAFLTLQEMLAGDGEAFAEHMDEVRWDDYATAEQKIRAAELARRARRQNLLEFAQQYLLTKTAPVLHRMMPWKDKSQAARAAYYAMREMGMAENAVHDFLQNIQREVYAPLIEAGVTKNQMGDYLAMQRIVAGDRSDYINPWGYTVEDAQKQLDRMKQKNPTEFALMQKHLATYGEMVFQVAQNAVVAGTYNRELFNQRIRPYRGKYVTYGVVDYITDHIPAAMMNQVGTFKGIGNPFDITLMKMVNLIRLNTLQEAKNKVIAGMLDVKHGEIEKREIPHGQKKPKGQPKPGYDWLEVLEDGKPAAYEVPKEIARSFLKEDIGGLKTAANILTAIVYKPFHLLYVVLSPAFQVGNVSRDLWRTWRNLSTLGSAASKRLYTQLVAAGFSPAEARQRSRGKKISAGSVLYHYFTTGMKAGWKRARGQADPMLDAMLRNKALSVPFVDIHSEDTESPTAERMLQQHGLMTPAYKSRAQRILEKVTAVGEFVGTITETASKAAAWKILTDRSTATDEKADIVRRWVGTPNFKERGLATAITNGVWMYSNVRYQGLVDDLELLRDPETRMGYLWRLTIATLVPATVSWLAYRGILGPMLAAFYGGGDDDDENMATQMQRVPEYDWSTYDMVPIGTATTGEGLNKKHKTIALRLMRDDTGQLFARAWIGMLDAAYEKYQGKPGATERAVKEVAGVGINAVAPSLSPPLDIASKWSQYAMGRNPTDDYFGSPIVPNNAFKAGGWPAARKMLAWTEQKLGVAGQLSHVVTAPWLGESMGSGEEGFVERVAGIPGINKLIRVTDKGLQEKKWAEAQADQVEGARFRESLPQSAREGTKEYSRLVMADDEDLDEQDRARKLVVKEWYSKTYLPLRKKIVKADEAGDQAAGGQLRQDLDNQSKDIFTAERIAAVEKKLSKKQKANVPTRQGPTEKGSHFRERRKNAFERKAEAREDLDTLRSQT